MLKLQNKTTNEIIDFENIRYLQIYFGGMLDTIIYEFAIAKQNPSPASFDEARNLFVNDFVKNWNTYATKTGYSALPSTEMLDQEPTPPLSTNKSIQNTLTKIQKEISKILGELTKNEQCIFIQSCIESLTEIKNNRNSQKNIQKSRTVGNGEGSLYYSEAKKSWFYQYVYNGNRKTLKQKKNESVKDFKARVTSTKSKLNTGTYIEKTYDTLHDILINHIQQKFEDGVIEQVSYKRNMESLEQLKSCGKGFMNKPVQDIKVSDIVASKKTIRKKYSQSCIDKMWGLLRKGFHLAYSRRQIPFNIMDDEALAKPLSEKEKKVVEALTIQEQRRLETILDNEEKDHPYADIAKFQLNTAMRIGEVLARSKDDIDFEKANIHIHNTLTKDKNDKTILGKHTKTYNKKTGIDLGERYLPMNTLSRKILQKQLSSKITNIHNLIFWDYEKNTFVSRGEVNSWLDRINNKYKITPKSLSSHVLRHTRITRWKEIGIDHKVIQYWAGHVEGSNITNDTYFSLQEEFLQKEAAKLEQA